MMIFPADPTPHAVAGALEALAARTGDPAYARAAKALLAPLSPGRTPADDRLPLAEVKDLLARGKAKTKWQACCLVARRLGPIGHEVSTAKRLQRKLRKIVPQKPISEKVDDLSLAADEPLETV